VRRSESADRARWFLAARASITGVAATNSRYEPVIGDALRSRTDRHRTAELASPLAP